MRVPGLPRVKDSLLNEVSIQYQSEARYSLAEIETRLDATGLFPYGLTDEHWTFIRSIHRRETSYSAKWQQTEECLRLSGDELYPRRRNSQLGSSPISLSSFPPTYVGTIPLEEALSQENRANLGGVVSHRNETGFALARDLIGCANWLLENGYSYTGEPLDLFLDYCMRCPSGGGWNQREWDNLWKSAQKGHPTPARNHSNPDGLIQFIHFWRRVNDPDGAPHRENFSEPDPVAYSDYLQWEEEQERVLAAQHTESFIDFLKAKAAKLGKHFRKGFGFTKRVEQQRIRLPSIINYHPDFPLPTPADYAGKPAPRIKFKKGQRLSVLRRLKAAGWEVALDISFMGLGKSYDAGLMNPEPDSDSHIWYLDLNHRNVSTACVRDSYTDLHPQHQGLTWKNGFLVRATHPNDVIAVPANCCYANTITQLREKGWEFDTHEACTALRCPHFVTHVKDDSGQDKPKCAVSRGDGYGFLFERNVTLSRQKIRAHIESTPTPSGTRGQGDKENWGQGGTEGGENNSTGWDYSNDILFIEEASLHLKGTKTLTGEWAKDLLVQFDWLESVIPDAASSLSQLKTALRDVLTGKIEQTRHGLDDGALRTILPPPPENIDLIIQSIRDGLPKISDYGVLPDSVKGCGGQWGSLGKFVRSVFNTEARHETMLNWASLPVNLLVNLLEVWAGVQPGALRVNFDELTVTIRNTRHAELIVAAGFTCLLDATADKRIIAAKLDVDPDSLIEIEEELPCLDNYSVVNVQVEGMKSGKWSDNCLSRLAALINSLKETDPDITTIGLKYLAEKLVFDGWWFNHNRGSNELQGKRAIAGFGTPYVNLGVAQDEYLTLFQTLDGFEAYYQHLINAEILQLIGRQRAHLYPEHDFVCYLIGTDQDLSFLQQYGITVVNRFAFELCPEAGTPQERHIWAIGKVMEKALATGKVISSLGREEVARQLGISIHNIDKIVGTFGGWKEFKKLLLPLLESNDRTSRSFCSPDTDWLRAVLGFPPLEVLQEVVSTVKTLGVDLMWSVCSLETRLEIAGLIVGLLPPWLLAELESICST
jgi:hypothetical protein